MRTRLPAIFLLIFLASCDILQEEEVHIVGGISLIRPNTPSSGYNIVLYDSLNRNLLDDYVEKLAGNDSILLTKCVSRRSCDEYYYKIRHNKGQKPVDAARIDNDVYMQLLSTTESKYHFQSPDTICHR